MKPGTGKFLAQADDFLNDARYLFQGGRYKGTANRAYYAMFATVQALLFEKGVFAKTHQGMRHQFDELYVRTQQFPLSFAKQFKKAYEKRQVSDYAADSLILEEEAEQLLIAATEFLESERDFLEKK